MKTHYFFELRHVVSSLVFAMGSLLIFYPLPKNSQDDSMNKSKRMFGESFLILPLGVLMCYLFDLENLDNPIFNISNLTIYFISITMFERAFSVLLDKHIHFTRHRFRLKILYCILYPLQMIIAYTFGSQALLELSLTLAVVLLLVNNGYCASHFLRVYDKINHQDKYVCTIVNSIYYVMGLGALCGALVFFSYTPSWLNYGFLLYAL